MFGDVSGAGVAEGIIDFHLAVVVDDNQIRPPFVGGSDNLLPVFSGSYGVGYGRIAIRLDEMFQRFLKTISAS